MRTTRPGRFSVERVFSDICEAFPRDIDARIVRLPFDSRALIPRLRNIAFTARLRADIIHVTGDVHYCALGIRRRRCVLTILDLESLQRLRGLRKLVLSVFWYRLPTWWANRVTVISEATKNDLVRHVPSCAGKVTVVPCPVGPDFLKVQQGLRTGRLPQVLQIGTAPNKNLERVVDALAALPVHLRILGTPTDKQRRLLEAAPLSYSVVSNLSDEELRLEYASSDLLAFVSTYEGFGLPIIEAQAVGLPVITSNVSSMPEVAGEGALLVDPFSIEAIRKAVDHVLGSPEVAEMLAMKGRENAQAFLPAAIAATYAGIYCGMKLPG